MNKPLMLVLCTLSLAAVAVAAPFGTGSVVVVRSGDATYTSADDIAAPAYLDEYAFDGTLVQSIPVGDYAATTPQFTLRGGNGNGGFISRSYDGNYLVLGGYAAPVGSPTATNSLNPRTVARVDLSGGIDTSTQIATDYSGNELRSVAALNGTQFWMAGTGSGNRVRSATLGATTSTRIISASTSLVAINIFTDAVGDPQLYAGRNSNANAFYRVSRAADANPKLPTGGTGSLTALITNATSTSNYEFFMLDANTLYLTDDDFSLGNGVQKWTFDGAAWVKQYVIGESLAFRGLTGGVDPATGRPVLFATTSDGQSLYKAMDFGPTSTWKFVASAGPNTMFHDVTVPYQVPEPAALSLLGLAAAFLLGRRPR